MLDVWHLECGYGTTPVLGPLSFSLQGGELLCLLGPNGVGKTTLFKTVLGLLRPLGGGVFLEGEAVSRWSRQRFARQVGYVPQAHTPPFPFKVLDVVAMGRAAHLGPFAAPSREDMERAAAALEQFDMGSLAEASYTEISGGERQLVLIARALVQEPRLLIMDEPTSNLDFGNQTRVLSHIRRLTVERGLGVILTTHHPNHALLYASRTLVLGRGGHYALGTPAEVITEPYLRETYGVAATLLDLDQPSGPPRRFCVPLVAEA